jgi:hypothetical protein
MEFQMKGKRDPRSDPDWYWEHRDELDRKAAEAIRSVNYIRVPPDLTVQDRMEALKAFKSLNWQNQNDVP